ncbi:hypothetical protein [Brumimicrobium oceani]|uniref:hypothetical protein n=1 Tax=Brumimicrobium oceani TaxID=2100725 RepID=UPI000D69E1DB|nr:hypothetical protein [Brumimicrobium oceani]
MKRIKTLDFIAILLITGGITLLDFDNLSFQDNLNAYIQLTFGALVMIYVLYRRGQASRKDS